MDVEVVLLAYSDGSITEDVCAVYKKGDSIQEFLDYYNEVLERYGAKTFNNSWRDKKVQMPYDKGFEPYIETLQNIEEKDLYKFVQKNNTLTCLKHIYADKLPDWLIYTTCYDPKSQIDKIEELLNGSILDFKLVEIYEKLYNKNKTARA